jgi:hypothetical protein
MRSAVIALASVGFGFVYSRRIGVALLTGSALTAAHFWQTPQK